MQFFETFVSKEMMVGEVVQNGYRRHAPEDVDDVAVVLDVVSQIQDRRVVTRHQFGERTPLWNLDRWCRRVVRRPTLIDEKVAIDAQRVILGEMRQNTARERTDVGSRSVGRKPRDTGNITHKSISLNKASHSAAGSTRWRAPRATERAGKESENNSFKALINSSIVGNKRPVLPCSTKACTA